jgi:hypothetical protein
LGDDLPIAGGSPGVCVDHDGDGYGRHCALGLDCDDENAAITRECYACLHAAPGCPCTSDGARTPCGTATSQATSTTICSYGESTCAAGTWGTCIPNGKTTRSFSSAATARKIQGLAGPSPCLENICDPYCLQFADTPDGTLTGNGIVGTTGGLTLVAGDAGTEPSSGSMPPNIRAILDGAGLGPAVGLPVLYHELPLAQTASDTVAGKGASGIDVYFLDYTIGRDTSEVRDVMDFARDGGIADRIQRQVGDVEFGAGHYEQYNEWPWNVSGVPTIPYEHVLSMTPDRDALAGAVAWLDQQLVDSFPMPRSWAPALFALSTTGGLRAATGYAVPPRSAWTTPLGGETDGCASGTRGYPCFRPGRTPITVLLADAPSNNGPGGQHAFERDGVSIDGAKTWGAVTPTPVTGNGSEATARVIDPTTFAVYMGNTNSGNANQTWDWNDFDDCHEGSFRAKNVFFKFHVDDRTWFHFDTYGSRYDTVLYLYKSGGPGVACNVESLLDTSTPNDTSSIDGVVDPGDYFLVVDGRSGDTGDYVLHVNAMPDGAASGPVAAPNYDEAIAAYNAIGGKIVGVDDSGFACHDGPNSFVESNTGNALEKVARDTSSYDAMGRPLVVHLDPWGPPCLIGDPDSPDTQIVNAVVGLANRRQDITLVAVDTDDAVDFDGPPGGSTQLTPMNIDDATFLASATPIATPESMAGCSNMFPDRFAGCSPGTNVSFRVTFARPPAVTALPGLQIFTLSLRVLADGLSVLSETPVVLVIPPPAPYDDALFERDYDAGSVCPAGTAPTWGTWSWTASTPGDSRIDFDVAVAGTSSDLGSSPFDRLEFTDPPGPTERKGQFVGALAGTPDTQQGGTLVDTTLLHNDRPRDARWLRLRAHLMPSTNQAQAPTLQNWNLAISCRPAE